GRRHRRLGGAVLAPAPAHAEQHPRERERDERDDDACRADRLDAAHPDDVRLLGDEEIAAHGERYLSDSANAGSRVGTVSFARSRHAPKANAVPITTRKGAKSRTKMRGPRTGITSHAASTACMRSIHTATAASAAGLRLSSRWRRSKSGATKWPRTRI